MKAGGTGMAMHLHGDGHGDLYRIKRGYPDK